MVQGDGVEVSMDVDGCRGQVNNVLYMEHVQAKVTLSYSRRGDVRLHLVSPSGTKSTLLPVRETRIRELVVAFDVSHLTAIASSCL